MTMAVLNEFQELPFYRDLSEQNHRRPCNFGAVHPLIWPADSLPPFQLSFAQTDGLGDDAGPDEKPQFIKSAFLVDLQGNVVADVTGFMNQMSFYDSQSGKRWPEVRYVDMMTNTPGPEYEEDGMDYPVIPAGQYYLDVTVNNTSEQRFYSEVICFSDMTSRMVRLMFHDSKNLNIGSSGGDIDPGNLLYYERGYTNIFYIDASIGKPEYSLEEEGEERDGYFFAEKRISKKIYRFVFAAPEYQCDILRLASLSDTVDIGGGGCYHWCDSILVSIDWEEQGDLARVEVEFTSHTITKGDSVIKKIAQE